MRDTAVVNSNPTSAVNPSQGSIDGLAEWPDDGPIAMLNLLEYNGDHGRAVYGHYAAVASQTIISRGGSIIFMGSVIEPGSNWDNAVLVYYPRRASYLDMQLDQAYVDAIPERTAGLRARLLYPFALPDADVVPRLTSTGAQVLDVELGHSLTHVERGHGEVVLDLPAGGPGLVTDDDWEHLRVTQYATAEDRLHDPQPGVGLRLLLKPSGAL